LESFPYERAHLSNFLTSKSPLCEKGSQRKKIKIKIKIKIIHCTIRPIQKMAHLISTSNYSVKKLCKNRELEKEKKN
jgi:hypothetical protein